MSGHSLLSTNAASCMIPILSGLAIFFTVAMSARGTSYRPTLSWAACSTAASTVSSSLGLTAAPRPFGSKSGCAGKRWDSSCAQQPSNAVRMPWPPLDAGVKVTGKSHHLVGGARAKVIVGGADDAVGAACPQPSGSGPSA